MNSQDQDSKHFRAVATNDYRIGYLKKKESLYKRQYRSGFQQKKLDCLNMRSVPRVLICLRFNCFKFLLFRICLLLHHL